MSVRIAKVLIVVAAIARILTSCGGGSTPTGSAADGSTGPSTLEVSLSEFAITPSTIHAPTGVPLSFHVTNDGQAVHTFSVDTGSGVERTSEIAPGTSATLSLAALDVGDIDERARALPGADARVIGSAGTGAHQDRAPGLLDHLGEAVALRGVGLHEQHGRRLIHRPQSRDGWSSGMRPRVPSIRGPSARCAERTAAHPPRDVHR